MRVTRRALLQRTVPALALLAAARPVLAAAPITIVVPYPPGGASDHVARLIAPGLAKSLGEAVEVVNEPGDSANRGLIEVRGIQLGRPYPGAGHQPARDQRHAV